MQKLLQPGEQLWANVGSLIANQTPDVYGNAIPAQTTFGSYEVRDLDDPIRGQVYEGKLVLDKTYGHAAYGCGVCYGYPWAEFAPTPFVDEVGNGTGDIIYARDYCTGELIDVTYRDYGCAARPATAGSKSERRIVSGNAAEPSTRHAHSPQLSCGIPARQITAQSASNSPYA